MASSSIRQNKNCPEHDEPDRSSTAVPSVATPRRLKEEIKRKETAGDASAHLDGTRSVLFEPLSSVGSLSAKNVNTPNSVSAYAGAVAESRAPHSSIPPASRVVVGR